MLTWRAFRKTIQLRQHWLLSTLLVLGLSLASTGTSHATDIGRAVAAYKQGYGLYYQKKHRLALQYFLLSYQSLPQEKRYNNTRNALNFLIGDCHYKLGQNKEAYVRLNAYVGAMSAKKKTKGEQYKTAQKRLLVLRKRLGIRPRPTRPLPRKPKTDVPPRRPTQPKKPEIRRQLPPTPVAKRPHAMGWVIAGLGVAALAGAVITGVMAQSTMQGAFEKRQELQNTPQPFANAVSSRAKDALTQSTIANALYIAGGSVTGIGIIMLLAWRVPANPS